MRNLDEPAQQRVLAELLASRVDVLLVLAHVLRRGALLAEREVLADLDVLGGLASVSAREDQRVSASRAGGQD